MELDREEENGGGRSGADSLSGIPLDRSKVRILLCEKDPKSSEEVLQLLHRCSYQVTAVRTARQVIEVLNAQGSDIDIILAEVDIPVAKGLKMLKYIMRDKGLRRIPIIMMSAQDEVSVVMKCLRLGAADYLVKPLRTNELLNLWTHMWRRRRMLGLAEKDVFGQDFELASSEPSDANTNSTNVFSDDTEDTPSGTTHPEMSVSNRPEDESNSSAVAPSLNTPAEDEQNLQKSVEHPGYFSFPKKTDLKVGECSAFLTYVKTSAPAGNPQLGHVGENEGTSKTLNGERKLFASSDLEIFYRSSQENGSRWNGLVTAENVQDKGPFPTRTDPQSRNEIPVVASHVQPILPLPIYVPEHNMMPASAHMFHRRLNDAQIHTAAAPLGHYNIHQHHHAQMMHSYSYHPVGIHLQSGQMPPPHPWSSVTNTSIPEVASSRAERRAAALVKFRQKRKDRCFDKKIRYVNRKRLAEKRPRVRGQFVRQVNGVDVGESEKDEDEEPIDRESELGSSPEPTSGL